MQLKMNIKKQSPPIWNSEEISNCLINILLLILFYIIGSTFLIAIGSKTGQYIKYWETHLSAIKTRKK